MLQRQCELSCSPTCLFQPAEITCSKAWPTCRANASLLTTLSMPASLHPHAHTHHRQKTPTPSSSLLLIHELVRVCCAYPVLPPLPRLLLVLSSLHLDTIPTLPNWTPISAPPATPQLIRAVYPSCCFLAVCHYPIDACSPSQSCQAIVDRPRSLSLRFPPRPFQSMLPRFGWSGQRFQWMWDHAALSPAERGCGLGSGIEAWRSFIHRL